MKHWTLRKLLAFGFAGPVVLILILAAVFFYSLGRINGIVTGIVNDNVPGLTLSNQAGTKALMYRAATLRHLISGDAAEMKALQAECEQLAQEVVDTLGAYERTIHTEEDQELFNAVTPRWHAYARFAEMARSHSTNGNKAAALALVQSEGTPAIAAFQAALGQLVGYNERAAARSATAIAGTTRASQSVAATLSVAATALALFAAIGITRSVTRTLRRVSVALDDTSSQVSAAATQVASASQSLAGGASEQAASLEETSASIEELSGMTARNSESAQQTKELSNQTRTAADVCARDMQAMNTAMDEIKSSSSDISKIIKTIDEIAFQTNILALNAAVEAARAGEAGMGFAVVAEEVRSLAQRSAGSAKETADKIAVAITKSEHGVRLSGQVAHSLGEIVEKARQVDTLVAEIATASHEQSQGIRQVNTTVSQMDKVTQSTASNAEETAAAAEELSAQAAAMRDAVAELRQLVDGSSAVGNRTRAEQAHPPSKHSRRDAAGHALRRPELSNGDRTASADDLNFADIPPPGRNGSSKPAAPSRNGNGTGPSQRNGTC